MKKIALFFLIWSLWGADANPWAYSVVSSPHQNLVNNINYQDTPYAPFPWPCDESGDCADLPNAHSYDPSLEAYSVVSSPHQNLVNNINYQDTPYAPFPWPCDESGDCAEAKKGYFSYFEYELDYDAFEASP